MPPFSSPVSRIISESDAPEYPWRLNSCAERARMRSRVCSPLLIFILLSYTHSCHSERQRRISRRATRFFAGAQNDTSIDLGVYLTLVNAGKIGLRFLPRDGYPIGPPGYSRDPCVCLARM